MQNTTHDNIILELTIHNHPGIMTHICGLFAHHAFNIEGILCLPIQDSNKSHIWLLVNDNQHLEQMISQINKLEDVMKVQHNQSNPTMFNKITVFFQ